MNYWKDLNIYVKIAIISGIVIIAVAAMITGNFELLISLFK